jgi:hypothetical protein
MNPYQSPLTDDRQTPSQSPSWLPGCPEGFGEWCGALLGLLALAVTPYFVWAACYIAWLNWKP